MFRGASHGATRLFYIKKSVPTRPTAYRPRPTDFIRVKTTTSHLASRRRVSINANSTSRGIICGLWPSAMGARTWSNVFSTTRPSVSWCLSALRIERLPDQGRGKLSMVSALRRLWAGNITDAVSTEGSRSGRRFRDRCCPPLTPRDAGGHTGLLSGKKIGHNVL